MPFKGDMQRRVTTCAAVHGRHRRQMPSEPIGKNSIVFSIRVARSERASIPPAIYQCHRDACHTASPRRLVGRNGRGANAISRRHDCAAARHRHPCAIVIAPMYRDRAPAMADFDFALYYRWCRRRQLDDAFKSLLRSRAAMAAADASQRRGAASSAYVDRRARCPVEMII